MGERVPDERRAALVVSRVLGHSSISITSDLYGHLVVDQAVREQVNAALQAFQGCGTADPGADPVVRRLRAVPDRTA
jgi:hypothetical protein